MPPTQFAALNTPGSMRRVGAVGGRCGYVDLLKTGWLRFNDSRIIANDRSF